MRQETINRCEKAYALIKQGEPNEKVYKLMGLGVGSYYDWVRQNHPGEAPPKIKSVERPTVTGRKKYDAKTGKKVRRRIKELVKQGMGRRDVAAQLNRDGITRPNGEPADERFVSNQMGVAGFKIRGRRKKAALKPTGGGVVPKAKDNSHSRLPASIELMLGDSELSARAKLEIILAYQKTLD